MHAGEEDGLTPSEISESPNRHGTHEVSSSWIIHREESAIARCNRKWRNRLRRRAQVPSTSGRVLYSTSCRLPGTGGRGGARRVAGKGTSASIEGVLKATTNVRARPRAKGRSEHHTRCSEHDLSRAHGRKATLWIFHEPCREKQMRTTPGRDAIDKK